MIPAQSVVSQAQALPMWVEYVKALGTPAVALLASLVGTAIAYRQWKTASNKLKLDFYDKRMEIYNSALQLINLVSYPLPIDTDEILKLSKPFGGAHWLLSPKVATHLNGLAQRCWDNAIESEGRFRGMTQDEKQFAAQLAVANEKENMDREHKALDELFAEYLSVKHS